MTDLYALCPPLNAYRFMFDPGLLKPLQKDFLCHLKPVFEQVEYRKYLQGNRVYKEPVPQKDYFIYSYETFPLLWVSNDSERTYDLFNQFFQALDLDQPLKKYLALNQHAVMYSGFFVVGNQAPEPFWHRDYIEDTRAMTLLTPLFEIQPGQGHLLYLNSEGQPLQFNYQLGEGLVIGSGFVHTTAPYEPHTSLRVLLSMTFGSDQWEYWPSIKKVISTQSRFYKLPCGHRAGHCKCWLKYSMNHSFPSLKW